MAHNLKSLLAVSDHVQMSKRVLLINTPYPYEECPVPPLGLSYLAGILRREKAEVRILDLLVMPYSPVMLRRELEEFQPDVVGASCHTANFKAACRILKVCKNADPGLITLIGGPHVSFAASDVLEKMPWIDFVVMGEGDETAVELLKALADGRDLTTVSGIAFRKNGNAVVNAPRPLIKDLDSLPLPARDLLPISRYRALKVPCTVITSRGCPFGCIFCSAPKMFGRGVRYRNPRLVVDEIEMIHRELGFQEINIVDDTFTVKEPHVEAICQGMRDRNLKITWSVYSRVDTINPRMLRTMREAGCNWVCFGLESGSQKILDTIKKRITTDKSREGIRMATEAGLNVLASFILGLPGENPETAGQTVALAKELFDKYKVSYGFHLLAPMPGTEVREQATEYGIRILTHDWSRYNANRPVAETTTFSAAQMMKIVEDYENSISNAWQEMQRQAKCGDAVLRTRVDRAASQEFVWKLLSEGAIERLGNSGSSEVELAQAVAEKIGVSKGRARREIKRLVSEGNLVRRPVPGKRRPVWQWA
ncbi:MAG: radical SAM protein [Dehalococcoidia bacterium]|nr:radical SAM protein [Dehalococcoidia bacterium]